MANQTSGGPVCWPGETAQASLTEVASHPRCKTEIGGTATDGFAEHKARTRACCCHSQILTPAEVAEFLKVPERTLTDWRYRQVGPPFRKVGRHVRYTAVDVWRWYDRQSA